MTCREKLAIEHPDNVYEGAPGGCVGCPQHYGYLDDSDYCGDDNYSCQACWDREIPETGDVVTMPYIESETMICQSCILCGESIPCGGPMICDSCRDLWKKLKEENT